MNLLRLLSLPLLLVWLLPAQAPQPPLPLADYWQRLANTQALVAGLESEPPETAAARLAAAADEWAAITAVSLPNGAVVPVDHTFLVVQLRAAPPDLKKLKSLLAAFDAARQTWPAPRHTDGDLRRLEEILARPEFQWQAAQPSLWDLFWEWVRQALLKLLSYLFPEEVTVLLANEWLGYLVTGLAALALAAIMVYVARSLAISFAAETEAAEEGPAGEALTADAALKRAQALSSSGDYRTAVRYLYLSALLLLDERGLLRYDRSLTNREYLRTVAHLPEVATILREVVEVFDRVWYGYQPLDAAAFDQYAARVAELRRQR